MVQNLWRVQFQGGDCPPPENCPPPEQFRGGTAKMSPPEELRGGTKIFSGASRPICPPPELNPVSATGYIYICISVKPIPIFFIIIEMLSYHVYDRQCSIYNFYIFGVMIYHVQSSQSHLCQLLS